MKCNLRNQGRVTGHYSKQMYFLRDHGKIVTENTLFPVLLWEETWAKLSVLTGNASDTI